MRKMTPNALAKTTVVWTSIAVLTIAVTGCLRVQERVETQDFIYEVTNRTIKITSYNRESGEVQTIPAQINGFPVTSIGSRTFNGNGNMPYVLIMPESITNIDDDAFAQCTGCLQGILFKGNAPTLGGDLSDYNQSNLTIFYLSGTTGWSNSFGTIRTALWNPQVPYAYSTNNETVRITGYIGNDKDVVIPEMIDGLPVTEIWQEAFAYRRNLTRITIPKYLTNIRLRAFDGCTRLKSIYFTGNAPKLDCDEVINDKKATIYYLPDTKGWNNTFGGCPTAVWKKNGTQKAQQGAAPAAANAPSGER